MINLKNILVISDSHIPTRANSSILQKLDIRKYDIIFSAGDLVDENTYFELINQESDFIGVQGNMDDYYIKEKLPSIRNLEIENLKIGIIHGHQTGMAKPEKLLKYFKEKIDLMIFGHSHKRYNKKINNTQIINPGAFCDGYYIEIVIDNSDININFEKIDL
ncbi:MAG: metallophosphoesterase family protein [Thermotogota bacterium]